MKRIPFTVREVFLIRRIYASASPGELMKAFPAHSYSSIKRKASELGLKRDARRFVNWLEIAKNHKPVIFSA